MTKQTAIDALNELTALQSNSSDPDLLAYHRVGYFREWVALIITNYPEQEAILIELLAKARERHNVK